MKTARLLVHIASFGLLVVAAQAAGLCAAEAQTRDHMRCHRVDDPSAVDAVADVDSVALGVHAGCTVEATARELCVPATDDVLDPPRDDDAVRGEDLLGERLCYRLRCPGVEPAAMVADDRFGKRTVSVKKTKRLCTPVESRD